MIGIADGIGSLFGVLKDLFDGDDTGFDGIEYTLFTKYLSFQRSAYDRTRETFSRRSSPKCDANDTIESVVSTSRVSPPFARFSARVSKDKYYNCAL